MSHRSRRTGGDSQPGFSQRVGRRATLLGALGAAATPLARPAIAQGVSGEIAFATFEWTLPHTGSVLRTISESFMRKHPNVRVREIPIPATGFHDQILTQLTAGTPPDIFRIDDPQLPLYIERNFLIPLDGALREAGIPVERFAAAANDAKKDGRTYAVVYQTNARQLVHNKALLSAVGINEPPRDVEQFEAAIRKATRRDAGVFGYTFASKAGDATGIFNTMGPIIIGHGGNFTSAEGRPTANDPRVVQALELIKRIWDADCVPRGLDAPAANRLTFDGRVALTLTGSFVFGAATPDTRPHLIASPSPLPSPTLMRASSWYGVSARGRNRDATTAWLIHMLSPESQAKIVEIERVTPALPHLVPASVLEQSPWLRPFFDGAANAISYLPPGLGSRAFAQVRTIADAIEAILYRGRPVAGALDDLQRTLEANLR
jgi:multiple sugar transport system substrate-binding protein